MKKFRQYVLPALLAGAVLLPVTTTAAVVSGTLPVQITIDGACSFGVNNMDFGTHVGLLNGVDATGNITVTCSASLPYTVELNEGTGANATVELRHMTISGGGTDTVGYELYSDAGRTILWGDDSLSTSSVSETGTGTAQTLSVYGRVPIQFTPVNGTYSDTVTVTILW